MGDFWSWLWDAFKAIFAALWDLCTDLFVMAVGLIFDLVVWIANHIPVPDFLSQYSLSSLFAQIHPGVLYFVSFFRLPECLAIIGAGVAFRLIRKLLTLGQW